LPPSQGEERGFSGVLSVTPGIITLVKEGLGKVAQVGDTGNGTIPRFKGRSEWERRLESACMAHDPSGEDHKIIIRAIGGGSIHFH